MSDLNTEIKLTASADGVETGVARAKRSLADLGAAAEKTGQQGGKGLGALGAGGEDAARKVDAATRSMQNSLQRQIAALEAGGTATRQYQESLAKLRGINPNTLKPLLDQLDAAKRKADGAGQGFLGLGRASSLLIGLQVGIGGLATGFVRVADATTILNNQLKLATGSTQAAGQAYSALFEIAQRSRVSFTELGSTYASIARAGESLGLSQGRLLGVTEAIGNAMTISGGSAAGMQAALMQLGQGLSSGTLRGEELNSVMEQTPRLARAIADGLGVTTGQLRAMGAAGQLTGEQVIKALEGQAKVLRGEVADATLTVGQAMTQLQNATIKTVGEFDKASGASAALASGISDLASVVSTMGRAFSENEAAIKTTLGVLAGVGTAAAIARTATALGGLAAGVGGVAGAVGALKLAVAGLNPVTLALLGLTAVAGGAAAYDNHWRGTAEGIKETIKQLQEANTLAAGNLERMQGRPEVIEAINKAIAQRSQNIADLTAKLRAMNAEGAAMNAPVGSVGSGDTALLRAQNADRATRQAALGKLMGDLASPQEKLNKALADARKSLGDLYSPEIEARITASIIKPTQAGAAAVDALAIAAERGAKAVAAMVSTDAGLSPEFASAWGDLSAAFEKDRINLDQLTAAQAALLARQPAMVAAANAQAKAAQQLAQAEASRIESLERSAGSAAERLQSMQREEQATALAYTQNISLAQAIEEVAIARLREQQAALMREGDRDSEVLALQAEIDARKQIASAIGSREARAASEQAAKDAATEWARTAQEIERSLTDALMRGFESGKDFGRNLRDTLVNMFKTLVLRPTISAILAPVAGALGGTANAAGGGGGIGGLLSGASNLSSLYSAVTGGVTSGIAAGAIKIGGMFGSSALTSFGAGMAGATAPLAAGLAGPVLPATGAAGMGAAFAAAMPWLLGATAVAALWEPLFGRKLKDSGIQGTFGGEAGFEGENFQFYKGGWFRSNKTKTSALDEGTRSGLADQFKGIQASTAFMASVLGGATESIENFTASVKVSFSGLSEQQIADKLNEQFAQIASDMAQGALQAFADYTPAFVRDGETYAATLQRLGGSLLAVNTVFDTLNTALLRTSLVGADAASQLIDAFGGGDAFAAQTSAYYQAFYSEQERVATTTRQLTEALSGLGLALPASKDAFRALIEQQDLYTEAGRATYAALVGLAPAFGLVADAATAAAEQARQTLMGALEGQASAFFSGVDGRQAAKDYTAQGEDAIGKFFGAASQGASESAASVAKASVDAAQTAAQGWRSAVQSMRGALDSLRRGTVDQMDPGARYAMTKAAFDGLAASALSGDADAAGKLAAAADDFLRASESGSVSQAQYVRDRAFSEAQLSRVIDSAQAQASVQDAIAAAGSATVSQLEALNVSLTGFGATLFELLQGQYQGADRGTADSVATSLGRMQADFDAYFRDYAQGSTFTDSAMQGASLTRLSGDKAAFTGADGVVNYLRSTESILDVARRIPALRERWEQAYGLRLPSFAVGTNYVPRDMLAQIHEGEAIVPRAYNPAANPVIGGGDTQRLESLVAGLTAEFQRLQAIVSEGNENTRQLADQFDSVTEGGNATRTVAV